MAAWNADGLRTPGSTRGRSSQATGVWSKPAADVMYPTTSSKSSSSQNPAIQVGSGEVAYARGVSVSINATRTRTRTVRGRRVLISSLDTPWEVPMSNWLHTRDLNRQGSRDLTLLVAPLGHVISKADSPADAPTARPQLALHPGAILVRRPGRLRHRALGAGPHVGFQLARGPEPLDSRGINVPWRPPCSSGTRSTS